MADCKRELHGLLQEEVRQLGTRALPTCSRGALQAGMGGCSQRADADRHKKNAYSD